MTKYKCVTLPVKGNYRHLRDLIYKNAPHLFPRKELRREITRIKSLKNAENVKW